MMSDLAMFMKNEVFDFHNSNGPNKGNKKGHESKKTQLKMLLINEDSLPKPTLMINVETSENVDNQATELIEAIKNSVQKVPDREEVAFTVKKKDALGKFGHFTFKLGR